MSIRGVLPERGRTPELTRLRFPLDASESRGSGFTTGVGFVSSRNAGAGRVSWALAGAASVAARTSAAAARAVRATESSPSEPSFSSAPASRKCFWALSYAPALCAMSPSVRCALRWAGASARTF